MTSTALTYPRSREEELVIVSRVLSEVSQAKDDFSVSPIEIRTRMAARNQFTAILREVNVVRGIRGIQNEGMRRNYITKLATINKHGSASLVIGGAIDRTIDNERRKKAIEALKWNLRQVEATAFSRAENTAELPLPAPAPAPVTAPEPAQTAPDRQSSLPLAGDFSPSRKLAEFWVRGVESFRPANVDRPPLETVQITGRIQHEFAKMVRSSISTIAQQRRYSRERDGAITSDGRFPTALQTEICDQFQIVPDEAKEFLDLLFQEIKTAVTEGAQFKGAWGRLDLTNMKDLRLNLSDPMLVREQGFVMSEDIE